MPKKLEEALKKQAKKEGLKGDRAGAYVYGTLRKTGWKPKQEGRSGPPTSVNKKEEKQGGGNGIRDLYK